MHVKMHSCPSGFRMRNFYCVAFFMYSLFLNMEEFIFCVHSSVELFVVVSCSIAIPYIQYTIITMLKVAKIDEMGYFVRQYNGALNDFI